MAVYGYTRVSTEDQVEGTSLDDQARRVIGAAMSHGLELTHTYREEGVSGGVSLFNRPEGCKLAFLREGDTVIVSKLDRMFRDARDALNVIDDWSELGVRLIIADFGDVMDKANPFARFMIEILAVFSGEERRRIKERTLAGRRAKKESGGHLGGHPPFGYRKIGSGRGARLVPDLEQQDAITTIKVARLKGFSYRDIQKIVEKRHGLGVSHVTIRRVVMGETQNVDA
ncbi:PinR Site-specific recombinases, DNA invertase Pin homologs [uncultured Caudovirales phage]|uniref:PinR Site-specific recombinases, DNA invertase Pin homologs n=1 Tax=uncultured Caudovirales phage TaxID=2100421 RepID=A0A6J5LZA5_9CAUD|nr:PinR Site-specific recombinases, DNA invertase Pin homologs [uncultured Caudovirales phage]